MNDRDPLLNAEGDPECDQCGACCCTFIVQVSERDAEREPRIRNASLPVESWIQTEDWKYRLFPLPFHDGCCFLGADKLCTVYETRPEVCRRFSAGSRECQTARELRGFPPLGVKNSEAAASTGAEEIANPDCQLPDDSRRQRS